MTSRIGIFILFVFFTKMSLIWFEKSQLMVQTKEIGELTMAEVYNNPKCGTSGGSVDVLVDGRIFKMDIGINSCVKGYYVVGDLVEVLYCKECAFVMWPNQSVYLDYWGSRLLFIIPILLLYYLIRGKGKSR